MNSYMELPSALREGHMNLLSNLKAPGTSMPSRKPVSGLGPLLRMKTSFKGRVLTQVDIGRNGTSHDGRSWFKHAVSEDGAGRHFIASLRNGTKAPSLAGTIKHLKVKSETLLLNLFFGAIAACTRGELEDLQLQTMPKRKESV